VDIIYATFTTPSNALSGSAVCAFRLHDVEKVFDGAFKEQAALNYNWLPVPAHKVRCPSFLPFPSSFAFHLFSLLSGRNEKEGKQLFSIFVFFLLLLTGPANRKRLGIPTRFSCGR
jgi:hypothetical protein